MASAYLLASDFPLENPRTQNHTFHTSNATSHKKIYVKIERIIMKKSLLKSITIFFLFIGSTNLSAQVNYNDYLETDFKLFWHNPVRAHPGVPLDFHYSVYEKDNQSLTWELITAPSGMSISQEGEVNWTATTADIGTHQIQLKVTREDGDFIERDFTLSVNTTDFLFVATTGDDTNTGTINNPYQTIEYAMRKIQNGNGKTIYIRDGTYQETYIWNVNGVLSPLRGQNFSTQNPMVIRSYPNEQAILDCNFQGHGFWSFQTSYVVHSDMEIKNAGIGERGGMILSGNHNIAKDITVKNSQWVFSNNVTGYKVNGTQNLIDRCLAYDNKDPNSNHWNSSSYLIYASGDTNTDFIYIINNESRGSSAGFKIKHAGPKHIIFHNNLSYDDFYGYGMASNYSSIRHSVAINSKINGISLDMTDPTSGGLNFTNEKMLIEQNTVVNPIKDGIHNRSGTYLAGGSIIMNNIIYSDIANTRFLMLLRGSVKASNNLLFGLSQDDSVRIGGETWESGTNYNFSDWQVESPNAVWGDPLFEDLFNNNVHVPISSPANYGSGIYAGAFKPGAYTLSINNEVFYNTISISPNPTFHIFTIDLKDETLGKAIIYNQIGQQIKETTTEEVDVSNLSSGIYFVKISSKSGKIATKKIIKN